MTNRVSFEMDVDTFTLLDVITKVAKHKGLEVQAVGKIMHSKSITTYVLDEILLAILATKGIKEQERTDGVFTLTDENSQEQKPRFRSSNYWNFKLHEGQSEKFELLLSLYVHFIFDSKKQGIRLLPRTSATLCSPVDNLPNIRMFKALIENDQNASNFAKLLVSSDTGLLVTWDELGLSGIKSLHELFLGFVGGNKVVERLGTRSGIFDPCPEQIHTERQQRLYVISPATIRIIQIWTSQLKAYRNSLEV